MDPEIKEAISLGLREEVAKYIISRDEEIKTRAINALEAEKDNLIWGHFNSHPRYLFGDKFCDEIKDEKLLQIMADCYDQNLNTLSGKIIDKVLFMPKGVIRSILEIVTLPTLFFPSNATKVRALKLLLDTKKE